MGIVKYMRKTKLFSVTKKDFTVQTFRSGGKGGQHQNKTDSGVRIIHQESGARGESRNNKSQYANKKAALTRLTSSMKFKRWVNMRVYEVIQGKRLEDEVEESMIPENLKIEVRVEKKWKEI